MSCITNKLKDNNIINTLQSYNIRFDKNRIMTLCNQTFNTKFNDSQALELIMENFNNFSYAQIISLLDNNSSTFQTGVSIIVEHCLENELNSLTVCNQVVGSLNQVVENISSNFTESIRTLNNTVKCLKDQKSNKNIHIPHSITSTPEIYSPERHISLIYFFKTGFQRWARIQGLTKEQSIQYLSLAFEEGPKQDHIDRIVDTWDSEQSTPIELLHEIIQKLVLKNESSHDLQLRFLTEKPKSKDLIQNFSALLSLRTAAYDDISDEERVKHVKLQFEKNLNLNDNMQLVIYQSLKNELKDVNNEYQIMSTIKDIQSKFKKGHMSKTLRKSAMSLVDINTVDQIQTDNDLTIKNPPFRGIKSGLSKQSSSKKEHVKKTGSCYNLMRK